MPTAVISLFTSASPTARHIFTPFKQPFHYVTLANHGSAPASTDGFERDAWFARHREIEGIIREELAGEILCRVMEKTGGDPTKWRLQSCLNERSVAIIVWKHLSKHQTVMTAYVHKN